MPDVPHPPKVTVPFCTDCKKRSDVHVVKQPGGANLWLCSSCELLRQNPAAKKGKVVRGLPVEGRPKPLQKEKLFDPEEKR